MKRVGYHHTYALAAVIMFMSVLQLKRMKEIVDSYLDGDRAMSEALLPKIEQRFDSMNHRPHNGTTFLWGIPTIDTDEERKRRQALRETYLSFYKQNLDNPTRICPLAHILQGKATLEHCQIAYTFFMAANPGGPTELLFPNDSFPILSRPPSNFPAKEEDDMVFLNIRENMNDGKMPTWFKYASMLVEDDKYPFDYVAKIDSDTLVFIPAFLEFAEQHMAHTPKLVHAGFPFFDYNCNPREVPHDHPCPMKLAGGLYMSGEASFLSSDLARIMTSKECNRTGWFISHEDVLVSNWAFHCAATVANSSVHVVPVRQHQVLRDRETVDGWEKKVENRFLYTLWAHATVYYGGYFKSLSNFRATWGDFLVYWSSAFSNKTMVSLGYIEENV